MDKPIQSLDEDITHTLEKLHTLLEYSTRPVAEEVASLIERARQVWEENSNEDQDWDHV